MYKLIISFSILVFVTLGCIQELEVFDKASNILVVYGELTDTKEAKVWVSYTTIYNTPIDYSQIKKSQVSILDDQGGKFPMKYIDYGRFLTKGFQAEVGRKYRVEIIFPDDSKYYSIEQEMLAVPDLDDIKYNREDNFVRFYSSFQDPADEDNFYRWRFNGTYEVFSPKAYEYRNTPDSLIPISVSPPCYDMVTFPPNFLHKVYNCWASDYDEEYLQVQSDFAFNGRYVPDNELFRLPLDRKFNYGYSMLISVQSITEDAFNYWSDIYDQLGNNGTIFETANYQVVGNMRSANNPDETVLGYFTVSAEKNKRIFVDDYMYVIGDVECYLATCWNSRCLDCKAFGNNAQYDPPDFWPEAYLYDLPF